MTRAGDPASAPGALHTDLYQLTMAYGYWRSDKSETEACFHLSFRENPFGGGFAVACGLSQAVEYLESFRFDESDIAFLSAQTGNDGGPLFDGEFLNALRDMRFSCDVDAVPEGTVVFAKEPLLRVCGPIVQAQVVETALLNIVNFQTLVATKAARVCLAAQGDGVIEFGLRRAQGPDGGLSASRAAYVGGCSGTSNVLAGQRYGIPVAGTHAHSWVMTFDSEQEAFDAWATAMPNNCTFLIDTYDTHQGARNAVQAGLRLRERGHEMIGVRIDSGDLAKLSIDVRAILDEAGFPDALIFASNELDEYTIESLKDQGAAVDVWGVGTRLVAAHGQSALGGVYKLSAVRQPGEPWRARVKISEQTAKVTIPGLLGVRRYYSGEDGRPIGDMVYDAESPPEGETVAVDQLDATRVWRFEAEAPAEDLLKPLFRRGERVAEMPTLAEVRLRALGQVGALGPAVTRFLNPHVYPVGLERGLSEARTRLILDARGVEGRASSGGAGGQT